MKVIVKIPNITQYYFTFEEGDEIYFNCMWARINLDHDTYTMTATTDCGDYTYTCHVTPAESFIKLMARVGEDYLLYKIADRNLFNFDESKARVITQNNVGAGLRSVPHEELSEIDYSNCPTEESFLREVARVTGWCWEDIPIEKDYPIRAITFAKLFCKYLQPILREEILITETERGAK